MQTPRLASIQVGMPKSIAAEHAPDPAGRSWTSAFGKQHVGGPVWVARLNLTGDLQGDTVHHGGPDKAVLAYAADHYRTWHAELEGLDLPHGAFGENFTTEGLDETRVYIGDTFAVGSAIVQVSQPRQPCWKIAAFWRAKDLTARVEASGRTGWYYRVLREGFVEDGDGVTLLERPNSQWSVARVTTVTRSRDKIADAAELAQCSLLSESWRSKLKTRIADAQHTV